MLPLHRKPLIAGIVVGCIASGLILSTLVFCLVQSYQRLARKREAVLCQTKSKRKLSLGT
jgi:hypothetical protein